MCKIRVLASILFMTTTAVPLGCADDPPPPQTISSGSLVPAPPRSLAELASTTRAEGGMVIAGMLAASASASGVRVSPEAYAGLHLAYPYEYREILVGDALGEAPVAPLTADVASGEPYLSDEHGAPVTDWTIRWESDDQSAWATHRRLPLGGERVFFVAAFLDPDSGGASRWYVAWAAARAGEVVAGDGTTSGANASLDELRKP